MDLIFIFSLIAVVGAIIIYSWIKEAHELDDDCIDCSYANSEFCHTKCKNN